MPRKRDNLPTPIISIIERHVGGGITAEEASKLGMPNKSYIPKTLEEKMAAYADKLIEVSNIVSIEKTIQKLREQLGADHSAVQRLQISTKRYRPFAEEVGIE